jgi:putative acetyltransferase
MIKLIRTDTLNEDFTELVKHLDADLAIRDGKDHSFYNQFNKLDLIKYVIVAYKDKIPIGCGAIKEFSPEVMEVKRMFVSLDSRGKGIASLVLIELEKWASELGFKKCILETGIKQPEAIRLYEKNGYERILNYGQYANVDTSLCFKKELGEK